MTSSSSSSLRSRADQITAANSGAAPLSPPAVAPQDPIIEVLIRDVADSLPAAMAERLESVPTSDELLDWLAAGAVYRWIGDDDHLSDTFLREVGDDPSGAGLALARAIATRLAPPPRNAIWHRCDHLGLSLQLIFAACLLAVRGLLFYSLGYYMLYSAPPGRLGLAQLVRGLVGTDLLWAAGPGDLLVALALGCAAVWQAFEATLALRVMEKLRRLPARLWRLPPPLAWRGDTFYAFWYVQAVVPLAIICGHYWLQVVPRAASAAELVVEIVIGLALIGVACAVASAGRSALALGATAAAR